MTAQGRSKRISSKHDVYPTPPWATTTFLEEWPLASDPRLMHWLEAGAGDGAIIKTVDGFRAELGLIPIVWTACEIRWIVRPELELVCNDVRILDFVTSPIEEIRRLNGRKILVDPGEEMPRPKYHASIFNPPFIWTMEFFRRCRELCDQVAMLQRQNFIGSADRNEELRADMPDQWMIPDRVDFAGDGQGDAIGHSWWTWGPHDPVKAGELHLLRCVDIDTRRDQRPRISYKRPVPTQVIKKRRRRRAPPMPPKKFKQRKRKKRAA